MKKSLPALILEHIFGRKYYVAVLKDLTGDSVPHHHLVSSYIFLSREDAQNFMDHNVRNACRSAQEVEICSFRSRTQLISHYNPNRHLDYSKLNKAGL